VNDANLLELSRLFGVKVSLRGDALVITGASDFVQRAAAVGRRMVELARQRDELSPDDVLRLGDDQEREPTDSDAGGGSGGGTRIALPGTRKVIQAKTSGQAEYLQKIADNDIVVGIGPAGTGKTYLAVAAAVDALTKKRVRRIVLARPAVEAGENLGFLPGDMQAKVDPYLRPLYDALDEMMPFERIQRALETRTIEIAPLAFMRGRTLGDAFVIVDEAQNATAMQMKMLLTRLGVNSRMVITGDKTQVDLPRNTESGLVQVERLLPGIDGIAFQYFNETDVVRHRLVRDIIRAYDVDEGRS
jgi:phosphate starvation-inducible PhoH-like protein